MALVWWFAHTPSSSRLCISSAHTLRRARASADFSWSTDSNKGTYTRRLLRATVHPARLWIKNQNQSYCVWKCNVLTTLVWHFIKVVTTYSYNANLFLITKVVTFEYMPKRVFFGRSVCVFVCWWRVPAIMADPQKCSQQPPTIMHTFSHTHLDWWWCIMLLRSGCKRM